MPDRTDIAYRYDGTYEGFMCCVFESYQCKEMPLAILPEGSVQPMLFPVKDIVTNRERAERVLRSIPVNISPEAEDFIWMGFLSCLPEKELYLLRFIRAGFQLGGYVMSHLTDDTVNTLFHAVRAVGSEAHLLSGFIRFSDYDGALVAVIDPKNSVLPVIAPHFVDRFGGETFLIYDRTHKSAIVHQAGRYEIVPIDSLEVPEASESEMAFRSLWRKFYDTIGIKERYNPVCRRSHMPKRYWDNMTEFQTDAPSRIAIATSHGA